MHRIVVADIFGKTSELEELSCSLGAQTGIVDPYLGKFIDFGDESEAYNYFMNNVGIEKYENIGDVSVFQPKYCPNLMEYCKPVSVWDVSSTLGQGDHERKDLCGAKNDLELELQAESVVGESICHIDDRGNFRNIVVPGHNRIAICEVAGIQILEKLSYSSTLIQHCRSHNGTRSYTAFPYHWISWVS